MQINTGLVVIPIERDGEDTGKISFRPGDYNFAKKYYEMLQDYGVKQTEFIDRAKILENSEDSKVEGTALIIEFCEYIKGQIDKLFGDGTSKIVFGDAISLNMFEQFFSGVTPYIQNARNTKMSQYLDGTK